MRRLFDNQPLRTKQHAGGARRTRPKTLGRVREEGRDTGAGDWIPPPHKRERQTGTKREWAGAACNSPARGIRCKGANAMSTTTSARKARQRRKHERTVK